MLAPGKGYKVRLNATDTLVYPEGDGIDAVVQPPAAFIPSPSGRDMSLLLEGLPPGAAVEALSETDIPVGRGTAGRDGRAGLAVWGDDQETARKEGLSEGERFQVTVLDGDLRSTPEIIWLTGGNVYSTDGLSVGRVKRSVETTGRLEFTCRPNPFNRRLTVEYTAQSAGRVTMTVFNTEGRVLGERRLMPDASSTVGFEAAELPPGVIFIRISTPRDTRTVKVVHLP